MSGRRKLVVPLGKVNENKIHHARLAIRKSSVTLVYGTATIRVIDHY